MLSADLAFQCTGHQNSASSLTPRKCQDVVYRVQGYNIVILSPRWNSTWITALRCSSDARAVWAVQIKESGVNRPATAEAVVVIVKTNEGENHPCRFHFKCKRCREFGELSRNLDEIQHFLFFISVPATYPDVQQHAAFCLMPLWSLPTAAGIIEK